MYKITVANDENAPHWSQEYSDELNAHEEFAKFIDCGFADEYATINLFTSNLSLSFANISAKSFTILENKAG